MNGEANLNDEGIVLSPEQVVETIGIMFGTQGKLSVDDLKRPQGHKIEQIYRLFVSNILQSSQDRMEEARLSGMMEFKHPEIHDSSAPLINFFIDLKRVVWMCSDIEISLKDIVSPSPKRTLKILSFLINFTNFKNSRQEKTDEILEEVKAEEVESTELIERNTYIKQKLLESREKKESEKEELNKQKEKNDFLRKKISALKLTQGQKKPFLDACKSANEEAICQKGNTIASREVKVLQEKHQVTSEDLKKYLSQFALLKRCKKDVEYGLDVIKKLKDKLERRTQSSEAGDKLNLKAQEEEQNMWHIRHNLQSKKQQVENKHSKLSKLAQKRKLEFQSASKEAELAITGGKGEIENGIKKVDEEIENLKTEMKNYQIKATVSKAEDDLQMSRLNSKYKEVMNKVDEYHCRLAQDWDKARPFFMDESKVKGG